jgi:hypothetical protein
MRSLKSSVLGVLVLVFYLGNVSVVQADRVDDLIKQLKDEDR